MSRRRKKQDPLITLVTVVVLLLLLVLVGLTGVNSLGAAFLVIVTAGVLLGVIGLGAFWWREAGKLKALRALRMDSVDTMTGPEFEKYVGTIFKSKGYHVKYTALSGDFGVDIIAEKGPEKIAIQTKRYKDMVGEAAVQQVVAGAQHYRCSQAMVVTNSTFTRFAQELARTTQCKLIGRSEFGEWVLKFQSGNQRKKTEALS